jgi:hypothetical protein
MTANTWVGSSISHRIPPLCLRKGSMVLIDDSHQGSVQRA